MKSLAPPIFAYWILRSAYLNVATVAVLLTVPLTYLVHFCLTCAIMGLFWMVVVCFSLSTVSLSTPASRSISNTCCIMYLNGRRSDRLEAALPMISDA
jgi:hypothetical protein